MRKTIWFSLMVTMTLSVVVTGSMALVSDYGEPCATNDQCIDHRMDCLPDDDNTTRCFCARFYSWINDTLGCVQITNTSDILDTLVTFQDNAGILEREHEKVFQGAVYAGIFVTTVLITCVFGVVLFCLWVKKTDRDLKANVTRMTDHNSSMKQKKSNSKQVSVV